MAIKRLVKPPLGALASYSVPLRASLVWVWVSFFGGVVFEGKSQGTPVRSSVFVLLGGGFES